jgi:hypothetical protein
VKYPIIDDFGIFVQQNLNYRWGHGHCKCISYALEFIDQSMGSESEPESESESESKSKLILKLILQLELGLEMSWARKFVR